MANILFTSQSLRSLFEYGSHSPIITPVDGPPPHRHRAGGSEVRDELTGMDPSDPLPDPLLIALDARLIWAGRGRSTLNLDPVV